MHTPKKSLVKNKNSFRAAILATAERFAIQYQKFLDPNRSKSLCKSHTAYLHRPKNL